MSEARTDRLEDDVRDIKAALVRLEPMIISINATLPHLATKAEVAVLPSRTEMWVMMGAMTGSFAVILTALTFLQHWLK
jgi:hypothetical protein